MFNWKKSLCVALSAVMVMGTTANASAPIVNPNTGTVIGGTTQGDDSSYIKKFNKIDGINNSTILGADFSHYQQNLEWNKVYYDYKGNKCDSLFSFVKDQGVNTVSVKVLVNPQGDLSYLSLENAMKTIKEAKAAGLNTNMILMYSDAITYAKVQTLPQGWTEANASEKAKAYTTEVLSKLEAENILPTMITIGNEVDYNFLGLTANDSWEGWSTMGEISQLVKAKNVNVGIGIAPIVNPADIQWIVEKLDNQYLNINYDYVGVTIYPDSDTVNYMETMRSTFATYANNKQLFVSGVTYPRISELDTTVSNKTQVENIYNLLSATIDDKNAGGLIFNEAVFVGSWNSFFDGSGIAQYPLGIFAYAQGNQVDVEPGAGIKQDPYEFGTESELKNQAVDIKKIEGMKESSIRGMDIGSYIALKNAGVKYYNYEGKEESLLKILSDNGVNYIRIRIWNDPYNKDGLPYGGGNTDVETGLKIANEAKKYGMKISLCFHYSDFWADPAQQIIPKAWQDAAGEKNKEKMGQYVYNFTKQTVQKFKDAGADIGMIQVGNEITNGMLGILADRDRGGNYAEVWCDKQKSALVNSYLKAGVKAVREVAPESLVALHLETGNVAKYTNIMNTWERDGVDYDVLGSSYYPFWSVKEKANTPERLREVQNLAAKKGKLFAIMETAWVNTLEDADGSPNSIGSGHDTSAYAVGPQGQVDCLTDMYEETLSHDNGLGAFYWEPSWIPVKAGWTNWEYNKKIADELGTGWASKGAVGYFSDYKMYYHGQPAWGGTSWDNNALFDMHGNALQSLKFYKESITSGKEQISVVQFVDNNGKEIYPAKFAKLYTGSSRNISIPAVSGYILQKEASSIKVTGEVEGIKYYQVKYTRVQEIKPKKSAYTMKYGSTLDLAKEITLNASSTLKYSSSNSDVVAIDAKTGKMTAKKLGTAVITVTADKTAYSTAATKKINVTVSPKTDLKITAKKSTYTVPYTTTLNLAKELTFNTKVTAKYSSSNTKVATVDSKTGKITAKAMGTTVITVKVDQTTSNTAATKKITVKVLPKVTVKNKGTKTLTTGKSCNASSYITVAGKSTVKYSSSNKSIAKVDSKGKITAVKAGKATITVKVTTSGMKDVITKKISVYVAPKQQTISKVTASSKALTVTLKKDTTASGYEIMAATNSKFTTGKKTVTVKNNKTIKTKINKLSSKKQYYVRVRSYKTIDGKKYYANWSTVKKMKTK